MREKREEDNRDAIVYECLKESVQPLSTTLISQLRAEAWYSKTLCELRGKDPNISAIALSVYESILAERGFCQQ